MVGSQYAAFASKPPKPRSRRARPPKSPGEMQQVSQNRRAGVVRSHLAKKNAIVARFTQEPMQIIYCMYIWRPGLSVAWLYNSSKALYSSFRAYLALAAIAASCFISGPTADSFLTNILSALEYNVKQENYTRYRNATYHLFQFIYVQYQNGHRDIYGILFYENLPLEALLKPGYIEARLKRLIESTDYKVPAFDCPPAFLLKQLSPTLDILSDEFRVKAAAIHQACGSSTPAKLEYEIVVPTSPETLPDSEWKRRKVSFNAQQEDWTPDFGFIVNNYVRLVGEHIDYFSIYIPFPT
ncbi:unnamed protein product [Clonostachys chloroleuca]|uniref:Uncharacterized protein n=1 Tax=Clonostachys chloroleuca TaxID=1926264 RepID=A0AA35M6M3_9HYPO|nr:unnamed protein product [Clonostachys chloroleuca]